jgi:gamma-glutamylaminecyclotransferase
MTNDKTEEGAEHFMTLFVYGTLKRRHGNHGFISTAGGEFFGWDTISGPYKMVSAGGFPIVYEDKKFDIRPVYGELWRIPADKITAIDALEGHPRWYKRYKLRTDYRQERAWMYIQPAPEEFHRDVLEHNMWNPKSEEAEYWAKIKEEPNFICTPGGV